MGSGWVHIRRYSGDFFINWISALYWSKVVGPANWCSVTHFTNKNVFKIRQGCTKAAITQKEREALEEKLNEIWVRFPYNPIHLLCMQHFHTFSHKYFSLTRVETCTQKKALYLSSKVFSTKVLIGETIFTFPTGDGMAFYVVVRAMRRSSCFSGQSPYLHFSVILRPRVLVRPLESNTRPTALQSSALLTELIWRQSYGIRVTRTACGGPIFSQWGFTCCFAGIFPCQLNGSIIIV